MKSNINVCIFCKMSNWVHVRILVSGWPAEHFLTNLSSWVDVSDSLSVSLFPHWICLVKISWQLANLVHGWVLRSQKIWLNSIRMKGIMIQNKAFLKRKKKYLRAVICSTLSSQCMSYLLWNSSEEPLRVKKKERKKKNAAYTQWLLSCFPTPK